MPHDRPILPNFKFIDTMEGLKYLNNNHELYIKILNNFLLRYKNLDFLTLSEREAKDIVHAVKGLSATLGMSSLSKISELLHNRGDEYREKFQIELNCIIEELDNHLNLSVVNNPLKTILILNDNERDIDNLVDILEKNYDVLVVLDITDAEEALTVEQIDLFLLSLDHTDGTGLKKFQETIRAKNIPIILTTERYVEKKYNREIIVKMFDPIDLLNKIKNIL